MLRNLTALSRELTLDAAGEVPEWIELLPPGPQVVGRDGRRWLNDMADAIVTGSELPLPLDWEHSTELRAPEGKASPAAGWIEELVSRAGSIWGRVVWNTAGQDSVASKAYRFISPVFLYEPDTTRILRLISAALTNRPNLHLQALNQQEFLAMDERLRKALGLPEGATLEDAINAAKAQNAKLKETETALETARNAGQSTPDMTQYVPMAQYDSAVARATQAETALNTRAQAEQETAINTAVDAAIEAGKIAPATRDFYVASCQQDGGLDRFNTFIEAAPKVLADSGLDQRPTPSPGSGLTPEQKAMCVSLGISEADYQKSLALSAS